MNADFSWINKEENLLQTEEIMYKEKINSIKIKILFIHTDASGEERVCKHASFFYTLDEIVDSSLTTFTVSQLNEYIQSFSPSLHKYFIHELLLYHVSLDDEQIQQPPPNTFTSRWSGEDDLPSAHIYIEPSLSLYHDVNIIYCIMKEKPTPPLISILKKKASNHTKKVRINLIPHSESSLLKLKTPFYDENKNSNKTRHRLKR